MEDKEKKEGKQKKGIVQMICAVILTVVGCMLLLVGFYAPPMGEIHSSVLVAYGETLTFVGALFGIDYYYRFRPK